MAAAPRTIATTVSLRHPSTHTLASGSNAPAKSSPPTPEWMSGTWHVTHSSLPMWKGRFGVKITYTPLQGTATPEFDDFVEYQKSSGGSFSSVHGVSKAVEVPELGNGWAYSWRGKGWLMVASSQWEILGYGTDHSGAVAGLGEGQGRDWAVTYFSKTMFTPAGIDIYSRNPKGISANTVEDIKAALSNVDDDSLKKLVGDIFEIPRD